MTFVYKVSLPECPPGVITQEICCQVGMKLDIQKLDPSVKTTIVEVAEGAKEANISLRYIGVNGKFGPLTSLIIPCTNELPPPAPKSFSVSFEFEKEDLKPSEIIKNVLNTAENGAKIVDNTQSEADEVVFYDPLSEQSEQEINELVLTAKQKYEAEQTAEKPKKRGRPKKVKS